MANGREDGIGGVSSTAFEITAPEMTLGFHVADHGLDGGSASQFTLDGAEDGLGLALRPRCSADSEACTRLILADNLGTGVQRKGKSSCGISRSWALSTLPLLVLVLRFSGSIRLLRRAQPM